MALYHAVSVSQNHVKEAKTILEKSSLLNRNFKIHNDNNHCDQVRMILVTTLNKETGHNDSSVEQLCVELTARDIDYLLTTCDGTNWTKERDRNHNSLQNAIRKSVNTLPSDIASTLLKLIDEVDNVLNLSYCVFEPMLLINRASRSFRVLTRLDDFLKSEPESNRRLFFQELSKRMKVTHVAFNGQISAKTCLYAQIQEDNTLRIPSQLEPAYGDFGPALPSPPGYDPLSSDFDDALWVRARQNGIVQIWAPRYTMFSQGNITEKTRLLNLPTVQIAVSDGIRTSKGCAAVDLFAGIGYFAFSYAKAGIKKVFCWDLNPWSIEGLRRGSASNGWACCVGEVQKENNGAAMSRSFKHRALDGSMRIIAFPESNAEAAKRLKELREFSEARFPPVRHVNAGMLPSAVRAWRTAVEIIDEDLGGWIYLHESVLKDDLQIRVGKIMSAVEVAWLELASEQFRRARTNDVDFQSVELNHVEKVKSMGRGLMHVVLDIWIPPKTNAKHRRLC